MTLQRTYSKTAHYVLSAVLASASCLIESYISAAALE